MSFNNEYVALLKYAIHLNIDISTFPTVWIVLSILLDTHDFDRASDYSDNGLTPL